ADVVLSGPGDDVRAVIRALEAVGHRTRFLTVSHAFHSPAMEPMLAAFRELLATITMRPPQITLISNVTGQPWGSGELDPGYWLRHTMMTVRFHDGIQRMLADGIRAFVEVGPHLVLTGLARKAVDDPAVLWLALLSRGADDRENVLRALGTLH